MTRLFALALVALIAASPIFAMPALENQLRTATLNALKKGFSADATAARAECETGKALLTPEAPKYLAAYSEGCFALIATPAELRGDQPQCPHYLRAIEIWRTTPPPMDDEDDAIKRAGILKQWKSSAVQRCGAPAAAVRTDMGPIAGPIASGSRLATQEGISYLVPDGWTVKKFDETLGYAVLTNAERNTDLYVERVSLTDTNIYPDKATSPSGRVGAQGVPV